MKERKEVEKYFTCDCCYHALRVAKDLEINLFEFAIFDRSPVFSSFLERIRVAWHILRTGTDWGDHFFLRKEDVKELVKFLSEAQESSQKALCFIRKEEREL